MLQHALNSSSFFGDIDRTSMLVLDHEFGDLQNIVVSTMFLSSAENVSVE